MPVALLMEWWHPKDPTIGMWLKQAGYATAVYGKWNVGEVKGVSWPGAHGFDDWLIIDHNTGYFQHQNKNKDCHGPSHAL